jgi:OOP family OmpA-OmpF porin
MHYSDAGMNRYKSSIYTRSMVEIFAEIELPQSSEIFVRPGLKFITRGQHIDGDYQYELNAKYVEMTVPFIYTFRNQDKIKPYVLSGLTAGIVRGGDISLIDSETHYGWKIDVSKANMKSLALGLHLGAGIKIPVTVNSFPILIGAEINYHLGLSSTYSKKEKKNQAVALNIPSYDVGGSRRNRGFEIGVTATIPISSFRKKELPPPEPQPELKSEKPCYTIAEMKDLIRKNQNITGKKICAIRQINFEFAKSNLLEDDKVYLSEIIDIMTQNEHISVKINGHTDNIGSYQVNMNLSHDRAKAVYDYLIVNGIAAGRLSYEYFGATRPLVSNDTDEGRVMNRRVEFEIVNQ